MTSTRIKNLKGSYLKEQHKNLHGMTYLTDNNKFDSKNPMLPDFGTVGNVMHAGFYSNMLSNNGCDIESKLFGIGSSDLEDTHRNITPSLNKMKYLAFFDRPSLHLPDPLVVEHNQRPTGPHASFIK
tara:strand:- start:268 stop:648 length:381 start_codon:yes stop_codon:yes gene_type:complete